MRLLLLSLLLTSCLAGRASASVINVPTLKAEPKIDGQVADGEWDGASGSIVALSGGGGSAYVTPNGWFRVGRFQDKFYFLFVTNSMTRMPSASVTDRDGRVNGDDAVELFLKTGKLDIQLIANSRGVIYDSLNGNPAWNGPWKIATSLVGNEVTMGDNIERGFIVEAVLPLGVDGIPVPKDGDNWGLQVALDTVERNPVAVWQPMTDIFLANAIGQMVWGGSPSQLNAIKVMDEGRLIRLVGKFSEPVKVDLVKGEDESQRLTWLGPVVKEGIKIPGGKSYSLAMESGAFEFSISGRAASEVPISAVPVPSKKSFFVSIDASKIPADQVRPLKLVIRDGEERLWETDVVLPFENNKKSLWVDYSKWKTGKYTLDVSSEKVGGALEKLTEISLTVPEVPEWVGFQLPELPLVPDPFTPVKAEATTAEVFGRKYSFGQSLFLDQVSSLGEDVLSSPVTLTGTVNGQPLVWKIDSWKLESSAPDRVIYQGVGTSGGLKVEVKATLEFDGMVRYDWRLIPTDGPQTVRDLALVVPVKRSIARSFMQYSTEGFTFHNIASWNRAGDLTDAGWACPFTPFFWLGDTTRGIQWFAESHAGWTPADADKLIEVKCDDKTAKMVFHLADGERTFSEPIDFTFGLMASPVRPRPSPSDFSGSRISIGLGTEPWDQTHILIPAGKGQMYSEGCFEADFRPDWDPKNPSKGQTHINLFDIKGGDGVQIHLQWSAEKQGLQIVYNVAGKPERVVAEAPYALEKGHWYRLGFNFGKTMEVYLDGKLVISAPFDGAMPQFNWFWWNPSVWTIGGNMSLARWRISSAPRAVAQFQPGTPLIADKITQQLELLERDPTPLGVTDAQVGFLESPAYLAGNWTYDAKNRWLIAGPNETPVSLPEYLASIGVGAEVFWEWSKNRVGAGGIANPELFKSTVASYNQNGVKVVPYTAWSIQDVEPDYAAYRWETSLTAPDIEPVVDWREGGELSARFCAGSAGAIRSLWHIDQFMKLGAGGVYLDGAHQPRECNNPLHGHGSPIDPVTGKPVIVNQIFAWREYMKTMYRLIKFYRKDAIMDAHSSNGFTLPTMSFATDSTNGEGLGSMSDWQKYVDPEVIRAEFHSRQYGFNADTLFYSNYPVPPEYGMTVMGIHGQTPRLMWGMFPPRAQKLWAIADRFDCNSAIWMPYNEPAQSAFHPADKRVLVSAFVHPGKRALALVTNWSDEECSSKIKIDWKKLGLPSNSPIKVLNWNTSLKETDGSIEPPLKPRSLTYLWIGSE